MSKDTAAEYREETVKARQITVQRPKVKYIASPVDIPTGQDYVLVEYGVEGGQKRHALGLTITVARNHSTSDLAFLANVHSAKELAKREGISMVFACK
jgi:hypothetical protein